MCLSGEGSVLPTALITPYSLFFSPPRAISDCHFLSFTHSLLFALLVLRVPSFSILAQEPLTYIVPLNALCLSNIVVYLGALPILHIKVNLSGGVIHGP